MDSLKDILISLLVREEMQVIFSNLKIDEKNMVESACYKALQSIKDVLEDDDLDDEECFMKIEEMIRIFELGSGCGNRHDFG